MHPSVLIAKGGGSDTARWRYVPFLSVAVAMIVVSGCGSSEQAHFQPDGATDRLAGTPAVESAEAAVRDTLEPEVDTEQDSPSEAPDSIELTQGPVNRPIWIEGGTFMMGQDNSYATRAPAHEVTVTSFWLQEHEVTNAEFRRFDPTHRAAAGPDRHPVVYVQWREAMAYAESLGGSLPTEAQWEYAARGRGGRTYPWGEASPTCELAHYANCEPHGTVPVMSLPAGATPEGIHDLAGNVMEWVFDSDGTYGAGPAIDPTGPDVSGDRRVLRGGAWMLDTVYLTGAARNSRPELNSPETLQEMLYVGFRVAWPGDADPPPTPSR